MLTLALAVGCRPDEPGETGEPGDTAGGPPTHDPMELVWTVESDDEESWFGSSVAIAGDVDGDGYDDVLVGGIRYSDGQEREGRVWLFRGSAHGPSETAAWSVESNEPYAMLGQGLGPAGDVDGDGFDDFLVTSSGAGLVLLFHGSSAGPAAEAAWRAFPDDGERSYPPTAAAAGDINADGYGDVVVGDQEYDASGERSGRVALFLGSAAGLSQDAAWSRQGAAPQTGLGSSVAGAGDVDGDGYDDVLVASAGALDGGDGSCLQLFLGGAAGPEDEPSWSACVPDDNTSFGDALASAGDVDGDGYDDVLVGMSSASFGAHSNGGVWLYSGGPAGLSATPTWSVVPAAADASMGDVVTGAGDLNGDGYADIAVAASGEANVSVHLGSPQGLGAGAAWVGSEDQEGSAYGTALAGGGDLDGDGFGDLVVGAKFYDGGQDLEGRVYGYLGSSTVGAEGEGPAEPPWAPGVRRSTTMGTWSIAGDEAWAALGGTLAGAGDVDGDGLDDLAIGIPRASLGAWQEGAVLLFSGAPSCPAAEASWLGESNRREGWLGAALAAAGDVQGDGYADLLVGSANLNLMHSHDNETFLYAGSPDGLAAEPSWSYAGEDDVQFGQAVTSAGDVDGDGCDDVLVGAAPSGERAWAFLFAGATTGLEATPSWTLESGEGASYYSSAVASAGDVDGDGHADLLVGLPDSGSYLGEARLYLGTTIGPELEAAWSMPYAMDMTTGVPIATAGDVDGDDFGDVLIVTTDAHGALRVDLYQGAPAGLPEAAAWSTALESGGFVSAAGDMDGDGFDDVATGFGAEESAGRLDIFLGTSGGLLTDAAWSLVLSFDGDVRAAPAGDVNGDWFGDLVLGAPTWSGELESEGLAMLLLGSPDGPLTHW